MELPSEEGDEMAIPLNSTYGGGHGHAHMIHHHHHHDHHHDHPPPSHNHIIIPSSAAAPQIDDFKKPPAAGVRYRECLKNHAAAMGGNATDGCGEFMPSGDDGTLEALTCSACTCHRNFHRKETEADARINSRKLFHHHHRGGYAESMGYHHHHHAAGALRAAPHQMIMSYGGGGESDEQEHVVRAPHMVKKRFRTKFSQEQKEKMLSFAEKVGWKIQKQEEGVVQQFCQEVGVKRRVLKVWMHNNKHTLAKKSTIQSDPQIQTLGTDN